MTLQARFAAALQSHLAREHEALAKLRARVAEPTPATEDQDAAAWFADFDTWQANRAEALARHLADATAARVEALADVLARDAEAVCAALVPEEDRAAVLAELEVDQWPVLAHPGGRHKWACALWPQGRAGFAEEHAWAICPSRALVGIGAADGAAPAVFDGFFYGGTPYWPPGPRGPRDLATLPPESTRPWLSTVGAVLVTDAHWRVCPEHGALWTLGTLAGGTLARGEHEAAARWALTTAGEEQDADTIKALAGEVHKHAGGLAAQLGKYTAAELADTSAGLLKADDLAAAYLARIGRTGKEAADAIRSAARDRCAAHQEGAALALWRLWRPERKDQPCARLLWEAARFVTDDDGDEHLDPKTQRDHEGAPPVLQTLAVVLWHDKVRPRLEAERRRASDTAPYLSRSGAAFIVAVQRPGNEVAPLANDSAGQLALFPPADRRPRHALAPIIVTPEVEDLIARLPDALSEVLAHRTIRELAGTTAQQFFDRDVDWRVARYSGMRALWQSMGAAGREDGAKLAAILNIGAALDVGEIIGGRGRGLWTWEERGSTRDRALTVTVGNILAPYQVDLRRLEHGRSRHKVWLPRQAPPLVGKRSTYGAQFNHQWALFWHFSQNPGEIDADGAFVLVPMAQSRLADMAGLPKAMIAKVLDAYLTGQGDALPILVKRDRGRYGFARAYQSIADRLLRRRNLSVAGSRSAAKEQERLEKLAARTGAADRQEEKPRDNG